MQLDSNLFIHDSDKAAMTALKAIPGFTQVMKAFMKVWNEQQFKLINMSTNLRLGEKQMKKYYDMLPPICEKLGIEVPELYVKLDVYPNAYTYGDTKPFIVVTSGLFETVPDELIPTVLAHECGHIACHHTLYTTMGQAILNGAASFVSGIGNIALYPIQLAFAYWMRCSEFSADRAAMICDGGSDKVVEMCMRFAGCDKDIMASTSVDAFIEQAKDYRELVDNSAWNKTLEFIMFQSYDHPLNSVRAYEAREWGQGERFINIMDYLNCPSDSASLKLPVQITPTKYVGKNYADIQSKLMGLGFANISLIRVTEKIAKEKDGEITLISIDGATDLSDDFYKRESAIEITYYESKTDDEIALEHPDELLMEENHKYYIGKAVDSAVEELEQIGFTNIVKKEMALPKFGKKGKEDTVAKIIIDGQSQFEKKSWFMPDVEVILYYYVSID